MIDPNLVGWLAAGLTLLTFSMRSMLWLRLTALAANICFIAYAALTALAPVLVLHLLLFPCNLMRLRQLLAEAQDRYTLLPPTLNRAGSRRARRRGPAVSIVRDGRDWLLLPATRPGPRHERPAWPPSRCLGSAAARDALRQDPGSGDDPSGIDRLAGDGADARRLAAARDDPALHWPARRPPTCRKPSKELPR